MQERAKVVTLHNELTGVEDKYLLMAHPLGEGRYAKVYKAVSVNDPQKAFAVKVIRLQSEEVRREYLKELRIIQSLPDCPNLVKTHKEHLESGNNLYIFQEYCESGTLINYRLQRGETPLGEEEIYDLFFQVATGLITLLQAGIVHEDIKPANILRKGRTFKLCDFGVSEVGVECKETTTRKGTISYMPPEKLKSRRFLPNQKSDIYSLGTCVYEVVFGFHPYLKKKTANYKEYLSALEEAKLKPLSHLMKMIGSSSLRLENFLKFLQRMIDLNVRSRVSLAELKEFLANTQPFRFMSANEEPLQKKSAAYLIESEHLVNAYQSVIRFRKNNADPLLVTTEKHSNQGIQAKSEERIETEAQERRDEAERKQEAVLKEQILQQFEEQNRQIVNLIGYLIRGVDCIRKCNFNDLNILPTLKNLTPVDLSDCKLSRYLKYIIFQFSVALRRRQKRVYQQQLSEERVESLTQDMCFFENEFNKFLIECSFAQKEQLCVELAKEDSLQLWSKIAGVLTHCLTNLSLVKENQREHLQSVLYCCVAPAILEAYSHLTSIYSETPIRQQVLQKEEGNAEVEEGRLMLGRVLELEKESLKVLREEVERQLERKRIDVLFDIDQDSGEVELIEEEMI